MRLQRRPRRKLGSLVLCLIGVFVFFAPRAAAQSHHYVYLSSAAAQTISGFELDPVSGAASPVPGSPFNEGRDPGDLAFHPTGRVLYAVNPSDGSVSGFAVDPATGALTELPGSPFAVGAGATPQFIAVEPAGKFLFVAGTLAGPQGATTLASYYSIDAAGALNPSPEGTFPLQAAPASIVSNPASHFLYVVGTNSSNGVVILSLQLDATTGNVTDGRISNVLGQFAHSAATAPNGQFLWIGRGQSQGSIDAYAVTSDGAFGPPLGTFSFAQGSGSPFALAVENSGAYLYAALGNLGLAGLSIDSSSGMLANLPGGTIAGLPVSLTVAVRADPVAPFSNLYFQSRIFGISPAGALSERTPFAVGGAVTGIAAASPADNLPGDPISPISGPVVSLAPPSVQFPLQNVGRSSAPSSILLTNTGNAPLQLQGISLTGTNTADFAHWHNCLAIVAASASCTIEVTFEPQMDGARDASLSIVDNAPGSPHTVALSGTAQMPFAFQSDSSSTNVSAGQTAQYSVRLVPASGFTGTVFLTCTGAPDQATCDVPPSLNLNGTTTASFVVTVSTKPRPALLPARPLHRNGRTNTSGPAAIGALVLLSLWLWLIDRGKKGAAAWDFHRTAMVPAMFLALLLVSCSGPTPTGGGGFAPPAPSSSPGTPAGQYSLTLTATFGTVTESIPLDLTVQ